MTGSGFRPAASGVPPSSRPRLRTLGPVLLVGAGHAATHWIAATLYVLLPFISRDLGLGYAEAGLFISILHISSVVANFGSGTAVDLTGRRIIFLGLSLLVAGGALFAFSLTRLYLVLCVMVALIGASNNLWHPPAISYLSNAFPRSRGYVLAIHATGASIGDAVAPLATGSLLVWITWQGAAAVNAVPVFVVAVALLVRLMPQDVPSAATGRPGMGLGDYLRGLRSIARDRAVMGLSLAAGVRTMAQNGLLMFLPLYLADVLGVGPVVLGSTLMAMHVGGMIAGPIAGAVSDRVGRRPVVFAGLSATTVVLLAATFVADAKVYVATIAVLGFVLYAVRPVIHSWMMDMVPSALGGSATSLMFGTQALLSVLTPLVGGLIADRWGLVAVFYFLAALMLLANLIVFALRNVAPATAADPAD